MAEPRTVGTFTDVDSMLALLRQRQLDLQLSNAALERVCGFTTGVVDKYLGPSRKKAPGAATLAKLMDGLSLSGVLIVDDAKAARRQVDYEVEGPRVAYSVRPPSRLSREAMRRARPLLMRELARKGALARWAGSTPKTRAAMIAKMNAARLAKRRRAGTSG